MGNFSINHYARFMVGNGKLALRYVLDMAEIPTVTERDRMDTNGDGRISATERIAYLAATIRELRSGLKLSISDCAPPWMESDENLEFRPGAGGLNTMRLTFTLTAPLPALTSAGRHVVYRDANFSERTGWKEIVATSGNGATLVHSTAAPVDTSRELTVYPVEPGIAPPQQTEAEFTIVAADTALSGSSGTGAQQDAAPPFSPSGHSNGAARTPQDGFTQAISRRTLTLEVVLVSLALAFGFGAFHALSPGHGKAMVAAYLVGTRGTVRHAVFLGGVITLTHTIGVFALGLVTLIAAQYVVPERLYPALSVASGLLIMCVGMAQLRQRIAYGMAERRDRAASYAEFSELSEQAELSRLTWDSDEAVDAPLPEHTPVSLRSLIVLGVTGGALPCPSALVVMLGAIALHRIVFGMALIGAFSLGLASVLTGIGILVVRLKGLLNRLPSHERLTSRLPALSAALVTLVGLCLVVRALHGQP
jgi:ABC-type nickel/cobalt efflux system permease component RcnA